MRESERNRSSAAAPRNPPAVVITDARGAASAEMSSRIRRYTITMGFRMACFLGMIFVTGWPRWVLLACAVLLPYLAVVVANQADHRTKSTTVEPGAPVDAAQLTTGSTVPFGSGEVIEGSVVDDLLDDRDADDEPRGRVA